LSNHPRNVPDNILEKLPANGGVVLVTFIPAFVSQEVKDWEDPLQELVEGFDEDGDEYARITEKYRASHQPIPRGTIKLVADHIEHVRDVAGIDHVGIGSDFWGDPNDVSEGLEDVSKFPFLFAELIDRGWSDDELKKLAGLNMLRVLRKAETVAARLKNERPASIASIEVISSN
jgi:membrane dipeptidase